MYPYMKAGKLYYTPCYWFAKLMNNRLIALIQLRDGTITERSLL